jgi:hypothetical protein
MTGGGGAFGSTGGCGAALGSPGWAFGVLVVAGAGTGDAAVAAGGVAAVVVGGGAGSGSALEVAGSAMVTTLAPVTAAIANVAHSPFRRVGVGST